MRDDGRLLVIRRGQAPSKGMWSIPGGRVEAGESVSDAARREVQEETGLEIAVRRVLGIVELPAADGVYEVTDVTATVVGDPDRLSAGDDASEARWVSRTELEALECSPGLVHTLTGWGIWS